MIEAGTFTVWIALVDATVASGALQYIPGSHAGGAWRTPPCREMIERACAGWCRTSSGSAWPRWRWSSRPGASPSTTA